MKDTNQTVDYDELLRLAEETPPGTAIVARSIEEAEALSQWLNDFEARQ